MTTAIAITAGAALFVIIELIERLTELRRMPKVRSEYCVQFRLKGADDKWDVINWSIGTHKRARYSLKCMLKDNTHKHYEYRVATRKISEWKA